MQNSKQLEAEIKFSGDTLCIINWLCVRGLHVRVSDSRDRIEGFVDNCLRVEEEIFSLPFRPIAGLHDGLRKL